MSIKSPIVLGLAVFLLSKMGSVLLYIYPIGSISFLIGWLQRISFQYSKAIDLSEIQFF
jgi:uncharacterized membrane protein YgdD (TMEM256/DUF423 family)